MQHSVAPLPVRVLLAALSIALLSAAPAAAHDDDEGVVWGEDPADIVVIDDCSVLQRNFYAVYAVDHRLDRELAAVATRMEIESPEGVVTGFTIASPGWRPHVEQPESPAHAERRSPATTIGDLLLRIGLEHRTADTPEFVSFELRVFVAGAPETFLLEAPRVVEVDDPSSMELVRQWCHEPVLVSESAATVDEAASSAGSDTGSFPAGVIGVVVLGISGVAGVLLVLRRRR